MTQETPTPSLTAGQLKQTCFGSEQERLEAYAEALKVSNNTGPQGEKGEKGATGETPDWSFDLILIQTVAIPAGVTQVSAESSLLGKVVQIDGSAADINTAPPFCLGPVDGSVQHFTFRDEDAVTAAGFALKIYQLKKVN